VSYFVTPILSLQLANPGTGQAFETTVVNADFVAIDTGIGADRTRLSALELAKTVSTADLTSLALLSPTVYPGQIVVVQALKCQFASIGGIWVQLDESQFGASSTRDTEYAKAGGAYLVQHARSYITGTKVHYEYDGAAWNQRLLSGLVPVIPTTVSAGCTVGPGGKVIVAAGTVGPINIDGITGFENYDLTIKLVGAAAMSITVQLRTPVPANDTSTNYDDLPLVGTGAAASSTAATGQSSWSLGVSALKHVVVGILVGLGIAESTDFVYTAHDYNPAAGSAQLKVSGSGHRSATAYAGISIILSGSTATGEIWIKGKSD
jgi:hypothetical protein